MKRQISILCFLMIILMLFTSCNSVKEPTVQPSENSASETGDVKPTEKPTEEYESKYRITRQGYDADNIFKDSAELEMVIFSDMYFSADAIPSHSVKIGQEDVLLTYKHSKDQGSLAFDFYESEDKKVSAQYNSEKNAISQLSLKSVDLEEYTTQDQYLSLIYSILADLGITDFSCYTKKCSTSIKVSDANSSSVENKEGFYSTEKENEAIDSYLFEFVKYYGEHSTTDKISISFFLTTQTILIKFDSEDFVSIAEINIDRDDMRGELDKYIAAKLKSSCTISSLEITNEYLTVEKGNPCYVFVADIHCSRNGGNEYALKTNFVVFLNANNYKTN